MIWWVMDCGHTCTSSLHMKIDCLKALMRQEEWWNNFNLQLSFYMRIKRIGSTRLLTYYYRTGACYDTKGPSSIHCMITGILWGRWRGSWKFWVCVVVWCKHAFKTFKFWWALAFGYCLTAESTSMRFILTVPKRYSGSSCSPLA